MTATRRRRVKVRFSGIGITGPGKSGMTHNHPTRPFDGVVSNDLFWVMKTRSGGWA